MKLKPVNSWDDMPLLLDIPFVVRILGISNEIVRKQLASGVLPGFKVDGRQWRITKDALRAYIEKL